MTSTQSKNQSEVGPYVCTMCSKSYVHYTSLSRHKRDYHPAMRQVRQRPVVTNFSTIVKQACFPYRCASCPKAFLHQTSLSRHKRDYHPNERRARRIQCTKKPQPIQQQQLLRPKQLYPPKQIHLPKEKYQVPQDLTWPPQDLYQPSKDLCQVPQDLYQPPQELHQPPQDLYQPPQELHQPPQELYQPPQDLLESSKDLYQSPQNLLQDQEFFSQLGLFPQQVEDQDQLMKKELLQPIEFIYEPVPGSPEKSSEEEISSLIDMAPSLLDFVTSPSMLTPESSFEETMRDELIQLGDAPTNEEEGIVMWLIKEDPANLEGYWNLIWSPDNDLSA